MATHLVSILVPAYNHEQYFQQTIKSIIGQTYENIELIILDDGSKVYWYNYQLNLKMTDIK